MSDDTDDAAADSDDHSQEMSEALRSGLRQAGYHVMKAGYELLAGVSAFLEAVGRGGHDNDDDPATRTQRIEVE